MKAIKSKIKMKLTRLSHYQIHRNVHKNKVVILSICCLFLFLILCGCQKKSIMIYMGDTSSGSQSLNELFVKDGDYYAALDRCQERLHQIEDDRSVEAADIYNIIGGIYAEYVEDEEQAMFYINKAIDIHKRKNDEVGLAGDYNQLAKVYIYIGGEPGEGIEYLKKAETLYEKYGMHETKRMAGTLVNIGLLQKNQEQYDKALDNYKEAEGIYESLQIYDPFVFVYKGDIYRIRQEYKLAEEQYLEAKRIWNLENNSHYKAGINSKLGLLYLDIKDNDRAIEFFQQALEFYTLEKFDMLGRSIAYSNIGYAYYNKRDLEKALENSINGCRIIENKDFELDMGHTIYKKNLKLYYEEWSNDTPKEDFEAWYKRVVLEGEDWQ